MAFPTRLVKIRSREGGNFSPSSNIRCTFNMGDVAGIPSDLSESYLELWTTLSGTIPAGGQLRPCLGDPSTKQQYSGNSLIQYATLTGGMGQIETNKAANVYAENINYIQRTKGMLKFDAVFGEATDNDGQNALSAFFTTVGDAAGVATPPVVLNTVPVRVMLRDILPCCKELQLADLKDVELQILIEDSRAIVVNAPPVIPNLPNVPFIDGTDATAVTAAAAYAAAPISNAAAFAALGSGGYLDFRGNQGADAGNQFVTNIPLAGIVGNVGAIAADQIICTNAAAALGLCPNMFVQVGQSNNLGVPLAQTQCIIRSRFEATDVEGNMGRPFWYLLDGGVYYLMISLGGTADPILADSTLIYMRWNAASTQVSLLTGVAGSNLGALATVGAAQNIGTSLNTEGNTVLVVPLTNYGGVPCKGVSAAFGRRRRDFYTGATVNLRFFTTVPVTDLFDATANTQLTRSTNVIASFTPALDMNTATITFAAAIATAPGQTTAACNLSGVEIEVVNAASAMSYNIDRAELIIPTFPLLSLQAQPIAISRPLTVEVSNIPANAPEYRNVIPLQQQPTSPDVDELTLFCATPMIGSLLSVADGVNTYRLQADNADIIARDIKTGQGLNNDRMIDVLEAVNLCQNRDGAGTGLNYQLYPAHIPKNTQQITLSLKSATNMAAKTVYAFATPKTW